MTCITYRDGFLAADRRIGDWMTAKKIFPVGKVGWVTGAGFYDQLAEIATWIAEGSKPEQKPALPDDCSSTIVMVDRQGGCFWLTWPYLRPVPVQEPFFAVGSGAEYALGAMAQGASAKEAVLIASRFDPATGNGVDVVRVLQPKKEKK